MGMAFQRRRTAGGVTTHTSGRSCGADLDQVKRAGNCHRVHITDGASWTV